MLLKNFLHQLLSTKQKISFNKEQRELYLRQADNVREELRSLNIYPGEAQIISLGQNCNSAWYLKQVELKKASYPFDWIFSSPQIIIDCIDDQFYKFLNKEHIFSTNKGKSAGHKIYHNSLFNHRDALAEDNFLYYKRCTKRFLSILNSQKPIVFIMTVINEPDKRRSWSSGFNEIFEVPTDQKIQDMFPLIKKIRKINKNAQFLFVEQYTGVQPDIRLDYNKDGVSWVVFKSLHTNNGVKYKNYVDNKVAKKLYSTFL
jgi:hypothetical protein